MSEVGICRLCGTAVPGRTLCDRCYVDKVEPTHQHSESEDEDEAEEANHD